MRQLPVSGGDTSAWSTSCPPATASRLAALAHAPAALCAPRFLAAQVPATAARDRIASSAVARIVSGCPLPPVMAMFAHGTQTLLAVIHPITTISHPNPSRGGCQNTGAGTRHWSGQRTPRRPVSLEGPRASYHAKRHSASRSAQVFPTFWRSLRHSENHAPGDASCFSLFALRGASLSVCSTRTSSLAHDNQPF